MLLRHKNKTSLSYRPLEGCKAEKEVTFYLHPVPHMKTLEAHLKPRVSTATCGYKLRKRRCQLASVMNLANRVALTECANTRKKQTAATRFLLRFPHCQNVGCLIYRQPQQHFLVCASCPRPASCLGAPEAGQGCEHRPALARPAEQTKARSGGNNGPKGWTGSWLFQLFL